MLCKNGDEEKKSLQKHFFDFEYFFFISNISFCKLLYHQIGGIGFDIFFFLFFFLCVFCVTTWDLAIFYAILMHFFSYRVTQGKSFLSTLLEHPVKVEWLFFFFSRHALYHFRSPALTCFNKESKSSTLLSCWPPPGLFLEQDRACSDLLLLFVPLFRWPLSSLDAPPESENECKKLLIYVYVWYLAILSTCVLVYLSWLLNYMRDLPQAEKRISVT